MSFIPDKKKIIVGEDNSFTEGLFNMTEKFDLKQPREYKALSRTVEKAELNGRKVWKVTIYQPIDEKEQ